MPTILTQDQRRNSFVRSLKFAFVSTAITGAVVIVPLVVAQQGFHSLGAIFAAGFRVFNLG